MERSIAAILAPVLQAKTPKAEAALAPIPDFGEGADAYQGYQVHDDLVRLLALSELVSLSA